MTTVIDKMPPNSETAEACLIGAVLHNPQALLELDITPGDFYNSRRKTIYGAILDVWLENKAVDVVLVTERLELLGQANPHVDEDIDEIGDFMASVDEQAKVENYAKIVRDKAILREAILVGCDILQKMYVDSPHPAQERVVDYVKKLRDISERGVKSSIIGIIQVSKQIVGQMVDGTDTGERRIKTGFAEVDRMMGGGFVGGNVYTIGGKTSDGKTTVGVNLAKEQAINGERILYVTREMLALEIGRSFLANHLGTAYHTLTPCPVDIPPKVWNNMTDKQMTELTEFEKQGWALDFDSNSRTPIQIEAILRKAQELEKPYDILYVDHLHIMHPNPEYKRASKEERVASIGHGLKDISNDYEIPVVMMAQLNREAYKGGEPEVYHLKDSGAIEQISKTIIMVYQEEKDKTESINHYYQIIWRKNRFGGLGKMIATWDKPCWKITNVRIPENENSRTGTS